MLVLIIFLVVIYAVYVLGQEVMSDIRNYGRNKKIREYLKKIEKATNGYVRRDLENELDEYVRWNPAK